MLYDSCATGGDKESLTGGATERTMPVIQVTALDEIVDNYDINTADTETAEQGKHAHYYSLESTVLSCLSTVP